MKVAALGKIADILADLERRFAAQVVVNTCTLDSSIDHGAS